MILDHCIMFGLADDENRIEVTESKKGCGNFLTSFLK